MQTETAIAEAEQAEVGGGTKKAKGMKRRRQSPGQADQKGELISPLAPLPPDFDSIASKTDDEKLDYIRPILARSDDEAIAVIAPALVFCGTAGSVVEAYLPLILEVKKHLCRPGRPKVDPAPGKRNKTWDEVCKEHFQIGIRRMQQILAGFKEPKLLGKGGATNRRQPIDRKDYERARQVAAPVMTLAEAVVREGLAGKFPDALEVLKVASIPVPDAQPASDRIADPDPGMIEALRQRISRMADTHDIGKALEKLFRGFVRPLLDNHPCDPCSTIDVRVTWKSERRWKVGDWVEYKGGDSLLTKRIRQDKTLGRVLVLDAQGHPRIRWYSGEKWTRAYSLYDYRSVGALFTSQAAERFPEAYGSYPSECEGASKEPLHERAACGHSVGPSVHRSEPTPPSASGDSGNGALPALDPKTDPQVKEPVSGTGAEPTIPDAAGGGQPEAEGAYDDEPAPYCQGDWVTFDSTCKYLGRFEGTRGRKCVVNALRQGPEALAS